jgi:hypothetical protein
MIVRNDEVYPWLNEFSLDEVILKWDVSDWEIFEYGSGDSTKWWAKRCKSIVSVDHDKRFFEPQHPILEKISNVTHLFRDLIVCKDCNYVQTVNETDDKYDLIIIDGRNRVLSTHEALKHLKPKCAVIFDDTHREEYDEGTNEIDRHFNNLNGYFKYKSRVHKNNPERNCETSIWWNNQ